MINTKILYNIGKSAKVDFKFDLSVALNNYPSDEVSYRLGYLLSILDEKDYGDRFEEYLPHDATYTFSKMMSELGHIESIQVNMIELNEYINKHFSNPQKFKAEVLEKYKMCLSYKDRTISDLEKETLQNTMFFNLYSPPYGFDETMLYGKIANYDEDEEEVKHSEFINISDYVSTAPKEDIIKLLDSAYKTRLSKEDEINDVFKPLNYEIYQHIYESYKSHNSVLSVENKRRMDFIQDLSQNEPFTFSSLSVDYDLLKNFIQNKRPLLAQSLFNKSPELSQ